ncbi:MAG: N-acetylmuramoyl-L-alanine amidase [Alphaproteobacteria bacterium]|jgi:peptidoglycan hydrolase-like protein with peptidoglycan-binding domain|nr:N-acetylmuramoyl-L-alanine amidase [Alphaproteobacteria bacterium]
MKKTPAKWAYGAAIQFQPPSRSVHTTFLHCSASDVASHDDVSVMREWHLDRGWDDVGYHYFITKQGNIQEGRPVSKVPAAQGGNNTGTIAICCHGLLIEKFTQQQYTSVRALCTAIRDAYSGKGVTMRFRGHCEVSSKTCPVYNYRQVLGLDAQGYMTGNPNPVPAPPTPPPKTPGGPVDIGMTDSGKEVVEVQTLLNRHGADLTVDGKFGQKTAAAVRAFQEQKGLPVTGSVDDKTLAALRKPPAQVPSAPPATGGGGVLKEGAKGPAVQALQRALNARGAKLTVDGHFGPNTKTAVINFQRSRGLSPDGIVGPKTKSALGLR